MTKTAVIKQVQDAYIVAATRTPVGKAPKGVFRNTLPDEILAHVLRNVVAQAPGIDKTFSSLCQQNFGRIFTRRFQSI